MVSVLKRCRSISVTSRRSKKHLNLGFFYGAHLADPDNLLEGSGKDLRHLKIRSAADLEKPAVRRLIEDASRYLPKLD